MFYTVVDPLVSSVPNPVNKKGQSGQEQGRHSLIFILRQQPQRLFVVAGVGVLERA
jgi:hypothetical protein